MPPTRDTRPEPATRKVRRRLGRPKHLPRTRFIYAIRPLLSIPIGLLAIVLGVIGYHRYGVMHHTPFGLVDSFYRAIKLFGMNGDQPPPLPPSLKIARILAPLVVGYAAVAGFLRLFREQALLANVRLRYRDHIVICGLGTSGFKLATGFVEAGYWVVVIERDASNQSLAGARRRGIPVLVGDATDPHLLEQANVDRAAQLVATCGRDETNVEVAMAARALPRHRAGSLTAFVNINDLSLWRLLKAAALATAGRLPFRLELFTVADAAAGVVTQSHPPFPDAADGVVRRPHVLIVGDAGPGGQLPLHVAGLWRNSEPRPGEELQVTLTGPDAEADLAALLIAHPELQRIAAFRSHIVSLDTIDTTGKGLMPADLPAPTIIYVCIQDEADALAAGLALEHAGTAAAPIVVTVRELHAGAGAALTEGELTTRVLAFGILDSVLSPEFLDSGAMELLARAKHDSFVREELAKGVAPGSSPALRSWDDLDETFRSANRGFADGIGPKLSALGLVVVPDPLADARAPGFQFSAEEIEELAREEHDRWMAERVADGWRYGTPRDNARKLHPSIVAWADLPEDEREKDRQPVRDIPSMLAHVGLQLARV